MIDSALVGTRPFSRLEMAWFIGEALTNHENKSIDNKIVSRLLSRLKEEFHDELAKLKYIEGSSADSFFKPLEDPYIRFVYGDKRFELENRRGDVFSPFSNYRLGFSTRAKLWDHVSLYLHPELRYQKYGEEWEIDKQEWEVDLEVIEGYVKLTFFNLEIEVGRDSLWWGPGRHGSWLLSNNAKPFDMIKLSNPRSVLLPWWFECLGPVKFVTFLTELEEDRAVPGAKLFGLRLNLKPHPILEIGISRTIMLGGEGREATKFGDYWKVFWATEENRPGKLDNNQLGGIDFSLKLPLDKLLPLASSLTLYGDIAGEDEAEGLPSRTAYLGGLYLGNLFLTGRTDLRVEYANNHIPGHPDYWYNHHVYKSGYSYDGRIIGHHMGSDADDIFVKLSHYLTEDLLLGLAFDREQQGLSSKVKETKDYWELELSFSGLDDIALKGGYRYEHIENFNFNPGDVEENHLIMLETIYDF